MTKIVLLLIGLAATAVAYGGPNTGEPSPYVHALNGDLMKNSMKPAHRHRNPVPHDLNAGPTAKSYDPRDNKYHRYHNSVEHAKTLCEHLDGTQPCFQDQHFYSVEVKNGVWTMDEEEQPVVFVFRQRYYEFSQVKGDTRTPRFSHLEPNSPEAASFRASKVAEAVQRGVDGKRPRETDGAFGVSNLYGVRYICWVNATGTYGYDNYTAAHDEAKTYEFYKESRESHDENVANACDSVLWKVPVDCPDFIYYGSEDDDGTAVEGGTIVVFPPYVCGGDRQPVCPSWKKKLDANGDLQQATACDAVDGNAVEPCRDSVERNWMDKFGNMDNSETPEDIWNHMLSELTPYQSYQSISCRNRCFRCDSWGGKPCPDVNGDIPETCTAQHDGQRFIKNQFGFCKYCGKENQEVCDIGDKCDDAALPIVPVTTREADPTDATDADVTVEHCGWTTPAPTPAPATDNDGDGVPNDTDAFPDDATESVDTDGDGVGDNADAFPDDATESVDTDGDGVGDNADAFPNDANNGACRKASAIAAGYRISFAILEDSTVRGWGEGFNGAMGQGNNQDIGKTVGSLPQPLDFGAGRTVKEVVAGMDGKHACVILDDDTMRCWGYNANGQCGQVKSNSVTTRIGRFDNQMGANLPQLDFGAGRTVKQITAGNAHTCALLDDGTARCWGFNNQGQLGNQDGYLASNPSIGDDAGEFADLQAVEISPGRTVKQISAGDTHTCAILDDDTARCWGLNSYARLGYDDANLKIGKGANEMGNLPALGGGLKFKQISAGKTHTCAILEDDSAMCWGDNAYCQLGLGESMDFYRIDGAPQTRAINVGTGRKVKHITAGYFFTCAILDNDDLKCWGDNRNGQTGHSAGPHSKIGCAASDMGDGLQRFYLGGSGSNVRYPTSIALGNSYSSMGGYMCATLDDGTVKCIGSNDKGQLGIGSTAEVDSTPGTAIDFGNKADGSAFSAEVDSEYCFSAP